jgi:hypothetical protein
MEGGEIERGRFVEDGLGEETGGAGSEQNAVAVVAGGDPGSGASCG